MPGHLLKIKHSAEKELAVLPSQIIVTIRDEVLKLKDNPFPHGYKKLKGFKNLYRLRVGDYRIIYTFYQKNLTIEILKIAHRKEAYK